MATIHEVARRAGVSSATVSRYLSGQQVRASEAVRAAIEELAFSPSTVARGLRSGKHQAIGVVVPDVTNPFFAALVKGIDSVTRARGYHVLLASTDESPQAEAELVEGLLGRVDGVVLAPTTEDDPTAARAGGRLPLVLVDRAVSGPRLADTVLVDNAGGAAQAARHLLDLGHTHIGVVSGPLTSTPGRARHEGFLGELAASGHPADPDLVRVEDFRREGGRAAIECLLSLPEPPTAVFCANNMMTIGALGALREHAVRIPREMSVVGFDDLDVGPLLDPPLTVVSRPDVEQGALAARLLLARLSGAPPEPPREHVLPVRLLVRGSTAPPARPAPPAPPAPPAQPAPPAAVTA